MGGVRKLNGRLRMTMLGAGRIPLATAVLMASAMIAAFAAYLLWKPGAALLDPDNAGLVARGEAVYREHCASCHGEELEGQPDWQKPDDEGYLPAPPHDETGHTWHHPDRLLFDITKYGVAEAAGLKNHRSRMPAFEGMLSDEEIAAALSYIKSRWPEQVRLRHDQLNQAFERARAGRN